MTDPDEPCPGRWRSCGRTPRRRRRSSGLNRERIVARSGRTGRRRRAGALSMARLAERLGCGTMSLYRHVANKDELVMFMLSTAPGPPPGARTMPRIGLAPLPIGPAGCGTSTTATRGSCMPRRPDRPPIRANWRGWMPGSPRSPTPDWPSATSWRPSWRCCTSSAARRPWRSRLRPRRRSRLPRPAPTVTRRRAFPALAAARGGRVRRRRQRSPRRVPAGLRQLLDGIAARVTP